MKHKRTWRKSLYWMLCANGEWWTDMQIMYNEWKRRRLYIRRHCRRHGWKTLLSVDWHFFFYNAFELIPLLSINCISFGLCFCVVDFIIILAWVEKKKPKWNCNSISIDNSQQPDWPVNRILKCIIILLTFVISLSIPRTEMNRLFFVFVFLLQIELFLEQNSINM